MPAAREPPLEGGDDAGRLELAEHVALRVDARALEREDLRHRDDVALHAVDLLEADHATAPVLVARDLDHDVDGRGHLRAERAHREGDAGHRDHGLDPAQRVARRVGVDRGERAVVAGVHGLQHVERLGAAHLADDDAIRPHAQRVAHEVALRSTSPLPSMFGGPRLEPHDVRLLQLQLRGVLDRDDALGHRHEAREDVEQRRLAGAGAAGDHDVQPAVHDRPQHLRHRLLIVPSRIRSSALKQLDREAPDRQHRPVERERRDDRR